MTTDKAALEVAAARRAEERQKRAEAAARRANNRKLIRNGFLGFVFLVSLFTWWGIQKPQGTIHVGICRSFVELHLRYPETLKITAVENINNAIRLYYTATGPFGEFKSDMMECGFAQNNQTGAIVLDSATLNRNPLPKDDVDRFSRTIPIVVLFKPDLTLPGSTVKSGTEDLQSLWNWD